MFSAGLEWIIYYLKLTKTNKNDNILSMKNILLTQKTPKEIEKILAERLANLRKKKKITQVALSDKAGVSYGSIKRFEQSGEISLHSLIKVAIALDVEEEIAELFSKTYISSIEELL